MSTAKVSVAIGEDELAWARTVARREGKSLSAVLTESLAEKRRLAALREVVAWMGKDQAPLSVAEVTEARRALEGGTSSRKPRPSRRR